MVAPRLFPMSGASAALQLATTIVRIDHLCCGNEAKLARELLAPLTDVVDVKISITERRAAIEHRTTLPASEIVKVLNSKHLGASIAEVGSASSGRANGFTWREILRAATTASQIVLFVLAVVMHLADALPVASLACAWVSIALSWPMLHEAYVAILRRAPNVELLMAVATAGSLLLGDVLEAASVGAIVSLMDVIKMLAVERFERQLRGAAQIDPPTVDIPGGSKIAVSAIVPGSVYIVRAGDGLPADGVVTSGKGSVDESRLTGEAMPQSKEKGSAVSSGSLVAAGYLEVRAEKRADESFAARIASAVKDAQGTLSESEELVGRFAQFYTPAVLIIGALIGVLRGSLQQGLVVIVAGCPCALLGAAPLAHSACLAALASRHKLLIKRSTGIEALARIKCIGLDKTGTLTKGHFALLDLVPTVDGYEKATLHRWLAAAEVRDNHPIARSLVQSYTGCIVNFAGTDHLPEVEGFKRHGRHGITATVDSRVIGVGNAEFLEAMGQPWAGLSARAKAAHNAYAGGGRTMLYVLVDGQVAAVAVLEDSLKPEAATTIQQLRALGVRPLLLTGDQSEAARRVADAVGIAAEDVHAGLLPEDKQRTILQLSHLGADGRTGSMPPLRQPLMTDAPTDVMPSARGPTAVGFVGDGLNDCAALASAHVGVVLQQVGSHATIDASSAVLQADIGELPAAITMARRTMSLIWVNVILALTMNMCVIVAAATVGVPLWLGVAMDNLGLLVVLANSVWPLCWKVEPAAVCEVCRDSGV